MAEPIDILPGYFKNQQILPINVPLHSELSRQKSSAAAASRFREERDIGFRRALVEYSQLNMDLSKLTADQAIVPAGPQYEVLMNGKGRTILIDVKIMGRPGSKPAAVHLEELVC
jgi:hypothetical protein